MLAQAEHDKRADDSADQRTRAAENRHQQRVDRGGQHHVLGTHDAGGMGPQHAGEPAEAAGDNECDVFVQPGVVAEDLHAQLALANPRQASPERRADQRVHQQQRDGEEAEYQVEEGHLVCQVDAEFGPCSQIDAVVAAGERVPSVRQSPGALAERKRDHQEVDAGRTNGEQAENGRQGCCQQNPEHDDQPKIVSQSELISGRQNRGRIGTDAQIGRLSEGGKTGVAEQDVKAHHENRERQRARGHQQSRGAA